MLKLNFPKNFSIKTVLFLSLNLILFLNLSCTTDPVLEPDLKLGLEDVSCTEAWLQLTTNNIQLPATINLLKNNSVTQTFSLSTKDSLLYIDSLLPNQSYKFKVVANTTNNPQPTTNEVLAQTMDTTSHNFTFETFTFGEAGAGGSTLYDVAIIDENNIWAVGEIYTADTYTYDSLGNWIDPYNALHWNGNNWELVRIYYNYNGSNIWSPIRTILAFSSNDIWFSAGIHWNGVDFITKPMNINFPYQINKMWGPSSSDFYVVGSSGNIAHYGGLSLGWKQIESGVDTDLKDIDGTSDGKEIWTCGWSNSTGRVSLLKINNNAVESLWDSQTNTTLNIYRGTLLNSLYTNGSSEFVLVGGQVLRHSLYNKSNVKLEWIKTYNGSKVLELGNYAYRIKGSNKNNIIAAGDAAMIWHFNGATWYKYSELYNLEDRLYGLAVTENTTVAVGKRYSAGTLGGALLIVGRR